MEQESTKLREKRARVDLLNRKYKLLGLECAFDVVLIRGEPYIGQKIFKAEIEKYRFGDEPEIEAVVNLVHKDTEVIECSGLCSWGRMGLVIRALGNNIELSIGGCDEKVANVKLLALDMQENKLRNIHNLMLDSSRLEVIDLRKFNAGNLESTSMLFKGCTYLEMVYFPESRSDKIKDATSMFEDCYALEGIDLRWMDTSNVKEMDSMFRNCRSLKSIDLSHFNTSKVEGMSSMFSRSGITELDLSSFDTSKCKRMHAMFMNCIDLETLNISRFNTSRVENMSLMFYGCNKLKSLDITHFSYKAIMEESITIARYAQMFGLCQRMVEHGSLSADFTKLVELHVRNHVIYEPGKMNTEIYRLTNEAIEEIFGDVGYNIYNRYKHQICQVVNDIVRREYKMIGSVPKS